MICQKCGEVLPDGMKFCGYCGAPQQAPLCQDDLKNRIFGISILGDRIEAAVLIGEHTHIIFSEQSVLADQLMNEKNPSTDSYMSVFLYIKAKLSSCLCEQIPDACISTA